MHRKIVVSMLAFTVVALACKSATNLTPVPASPTTTTFEGQASPVAQPSDSFNESEESPEQMLKDIIASAEDVQRDITYCTVDGVELKMDMYFPKNTTEPTPLTIYIHGGGWSKGDKKSKVGMTDVPALLEAGFTVASLNYRLASDEYQFPVMLQDVKCGIRSFRASADQYNIDPDKIGVWGESAGAHLSSMIGLTDESAGFDVGQYLEQSSRVNVVIVLSAPTDLTTDFSPAFIKAKSNAFVGYDMVKASPITYITSDDPPFLILQGDKDSVVPINAGHAQKLFDGLIAASVEAQMVIVQNGTHLLNAPDQTPSRAELTQMIVQFFEQHLK